MSVVIPAYNSAGTIGRAVASALAQTYRPVEIIVVDDGSSDSTPDVVSGYREEGVQLVRLPSNQGPAGARNAGIRQASGEFVAFLDADDEWLPRKLERQIALLTDNPGMSFAACRAGVVWVDGRSEEDLYRGLEAQSGREAWRRLLAYNFIATPAVVARRAALLATGGFNPELRSAEDQDLWIKLAIFGELGFIDEKLVIVHEQPTGITSGTSTRQLEATLAMVYRHVREQGHRLSRSERAFIRGHRLTKIGRNIYHSAPLRGACLLGMAILLGHKPVENLWYIVTASAPAKALKRMRLAPGAGR